MTHSPCKKRYRAPFSLHLCPLPIERCRKLIPANVVLPNLFEMFPEIAERVYAILHPTAALNTKMAALCQRNDEVSPLLKLPGEV